MSEVARLWSFQIISYILDICPHVWLTNILISAFLTETAEAELVCRWQFRLVLTNSLREILHHSLQLNIHHQKTGHRPFTLLVNGLASWISFWAQAFLLKPAQKNQTKCQMLHVFDRHVYIPSKLNGQRGLNLGSIALNLSCCIGTPGKPNLSLAFTCAPLTYSDYTIYVNCWP